VNFSLVAQEEFQYVITFSTAWRWKVTMKERPLQLRYPLHMRLGGQWADLDSVAMRRYLRWGIKLRFYDRPSRSLVSILSELYCECGKKTVQHSA
jgi:hypothetical protein